MKKVIVSNAGPIIALAGIGRLEILTHLFDSVIIPKAVETEILAGGDQAVGIKDFQNLDGFVIKRSKRQADPLIAGMLHAGEAEVIRLARELDIRNVLIDEAKARKIARDVFGLNVVGTARVLVEAKKRSLVTNVSQELRTMQANGYWIGENIISIACREAGEE